MFSPSRTDCALWYSYTACALTFALLVWTSGFSPYFMHTAEASQLQQFSDTLSTSKPGVAANHSMRFITPTGVLANGSTMLLSLPTGFDVSTITEDDVDIADDGVDLTTAATCGAVQAAVSVSGQDVTIEICSGGGGAIGASSVVTIEIGTNATSSGTGSNRIVNHASAGSYEFGVTGTMADSGYTRLVIVESVQVTGQVDTYLDFVVSGVDADEVVNGDATQTIGTTTATSVPFGTVQPTLEYVLAQDLSVTTNAVNGFAVTVEAASDLLSTSGATIDSFQNGTGVAVPTAWTDPSGTLGNTDTYGHWGLTTEDATLSDDDSFGTALYAGDFIQEPREVMYATTSANGIAPHIGATRVGYKLEVTTMQEAARDYTTTLTYVVTPVF